MSCHGLLFLALVCCLPPCQGGFCFPVSIWSPHSRISRQLSITSDCPSQYLKPCWSTVPAGPLYVPLLVLVLSLANFLVFPGSLLAPISISLYRSPWTLACFPWTLLGWAWVRVSHCVQLDWVLVSWSVWRGVWACESLPCTLPLEPLEPSSLIHCLYVHISHGVVHKFSFDCTAMSSAIESCLTQRDMSNVYFNTGPTFPDIPPTVPQ